MRTRGAIYFLPSVFLDDGKINSMATVNIAAIPADINKVWEKVSSLIGLLVWYEVKIYS